MQFIVDQYKGTIFETGWGMIPKQIMTDKEISKNGKLIYAYLASYAWAPSGGVKEAYPKQTTISLDLGMSEDLVRRELKKLYELGYVKREKMKIPKEERISPKARERNKYFLTSILREVSENAEEFKEKSQPLLGTENIVEFEPRDFEGAQNKGVINSKRLVKEKDNTTSSSEELKPQKKTVCDFLNKYDLKNKTKAVMRRNFSGLTEEIFLKSYNKLKSNPRVHTLEGALIDDLNGEWEEFEIPDNNKNPGNTGGSGNVDIDCLKEGISKAKRNLYVSKAWNNQVNSKLKKILIQEGKEFTINLLKLLYESLNYEIKTSLSQYLSGMVNKIKATEDTSEEILPEVPSQDFKSVEEKQEEEIQRLEEKRSETQELLEVFENLPEERKTEVLNATKLKYMAEIGVSVMQPSQEESFNFARNVYIAQVIKEWQGEELLL